ncbi:hypothetical protein NHX12_031609 [Muraenolepis orangiensis]|uniref:E3 ubiquitin-protein ligase n=1 Tax=Muraenolepis orangiensis TaxID=630683 RepID=A0A9Q0E5Y0_9TELE|nr:hypothetical protein NHX12_031609 [Muraenolepis orangiensis]
MRAVKKCQSPESQLSPPNNDSPYAAQTYSDPTAGDHRSTPRQHQRSTAGPVWEDVDKTETGAMALQLSNDPNMLEEDLSLVMDADMFQYLQKYCGKEYRHILSQNGVEVFHVTSDGVSTLSLCCETTLGEVGDSELKRLRSARRQITLLYQDNESNTCRVHLCKSTLPSRDVLQRILEKLEVTLPKILLKEDDQNIYLIGSYSDTFEAKKVILDYNEPRGVADEISGLLPSTSLDLSLRDKTDTLLMPYKDESRDDKKFKLAAKFMYKGADAFESPPDDFTGVGLGLPSPAMQTALLPMSGSDVLSGTARLTDRSQSRQNTGEDILFDSGVRPSQSSTLGDYEQKFSGSPPIPTRISPSGSVTCQDVETEHKFNYGRSSFGKSIPMVQPTRQLDDAESKYRDRDRANSFSHLKGKHSSEIYSSTMTVSNMIWEYIKEVYWPQLAEITTDIKTKEQHTDNNDLTTVILTALDSSKMRACRDDLKNLVAKVTEDFSVYDLSLTELGVADPADKVLDACCDEVRSRFKKITIHKSKEYISMLGPQGLCSQVASMLSEVFSGASAQMPGQQQCFSREASTLASNISKEQHLSLFDSNTKEHKQENNAIAISGHTDYLQNDEVLNVSLPPAPKPPMGQKEPVTKEIVKRAGTMNLRLLKSTAKPLDDSGKNTQYEGIQGTMRLFSVNASPQGHSDPQDSALKITYHIYDGIQGEGHPSPGSTFKGGIFYGYLPYTETAMKLYPRLEEAFKRGLTFTVQGNKEAARVTWNCIPHKAKRLRGNSLNTDSDVVYLDRLSDILASHGV